MGKVSNSTDSTDLRKTKIGRSSSEDSVATIQEI